MNEHGESLTEWRKDGTAETLALVHKRYFALDSGSTDYLALRWYDVVEAYSSLHLTFPEKDRSVALAGYAKEYEKAFAASQARHNSSTWFRTSKTSQYRYIAGLWTYQPHIDILWEQASPGPHRHLSAYPSWSWTSLYAPVLWINRDIHKNSQNRKDRVFISSKWGTPMYSELRIQDNTAGCGHATITMKTRLQLVMIERLLKGWQLEHLYVEQYRPRATDNLFRAVRTTCNASRLCGWASLERSRAINTTDPIQEGLPAPDPIAEEGEIQAILISTTGLIPDDFRAGYWLPWSRASNVLFVQHLGENRYERVGVGLLFGRDVDRRWAKNEPQAIVLV
jgi:hypothetical protein